MKIIKANSLPIFLGKQGENNATSVEFGLCEYLALYGPGTPQLIVQRNDDEHPYPVPLSIDGETAIWHVSDADTSVSGYGQAELRWIVGDVIAKSRIYTFLVLDSLGEASDPPEMWQSWLDEILGAAADVQETVENVLPYIDTETYTWHIWSVSESRYIDTGISARGEDGLRGPSGAPGATGPKGDPGPQGPKGDKGDAFTYADFTPEQLAALKGEKGDTGATGPKGDKGDAFTYADFTPEQLADLKGEKGETGATGPKGETGEVGPQGPKGETGEVGPQGPKGDKGDPGTGLQILGTVASVDALPSSAAQGDMYNVGSSAPYSIYMYNNGTWEDQGHLQGATGPKGDKGDAFTYADFTPEQLAALKGEKGETGATGPKGDTGAQGATGPKGDKGDAFTYADFTPEQLAALKGEKGDTGATGPKGDTGAQGATGPKGDKGDAFTYADFTPEQLAALKGEKGDTGATGPKGDTGAQGATGPKGDKGDAFTYADFTPEQLAALKGEKGDTGATGPKGDAGETGPQGPKGDTGPAGPKGDPGNDATIEIGTVTTVEHDQPATVENVGTASAARFNFSIPKGYTPAKGTDYWTEADKQAIGESITPSMIGAVAEPTQKSDGQVLSYDGETGKWVAVNMESGVSSVDGKRGDVVTRLMFVNQTIAANSFTLQSSPKYADFPYAASKALSGVTAAIAPFVVLSPSDATSGNFCPVVEAYSGGVYIYAHSAPSSAITIPFILCMAGEGTLTGMSNSNGVFDKVLPFTNKTVATSAWVSDTTYTDFPYRAAVACEGVTVKHYAEVSFSPADAMSGSFAPVAASYDGGVYLYASEIPEAALTIPTIVCTPVE